MITSSSDGEMRVEPGQGRCGGSIVSVYKTLSDLLACNLLSCARPWPKMKFAQRKKAKEK